MSITATVEQPRNELEAGFNFPVCTEALYRQIILPVANRNNLSKFLDWGVFVQIDANNFELFKEQLLLMKEGVINLHELADVTKSHVLKKLDALQTAIAEVLARRVDLVVLIG